MKVLFADSGFLIALYDPSDAYHPIARRSFANAFDQTRNLLSIAWPVIYESFSTRMSRRQDRVRLIEADWKKLRVRGQLSLLDDSRFRNSAMNDWMQESNRDRGHYRPLSLVDRVLRDVLSDPSVRANAMLTFNRRDFIDVCRRRRIEVLP